MPRLAALAGIGFVLLAAASALVQGAAPTYTDPGTEVTAGQQPLGRQALLGPHPPRRPMAARRTDPSGLGRARVIDDYMSAQFWRLARRIGKIKAIVAVAHSLLVAAYHVIATGQPYYNLGADHFATRIGPERRARHLHDLGHDVTLTKAASPTHPSPHPSPDRPARHAPHTARITVIHGSAARRRLAGRRTATCHRCRPTGIGCDATSGSRGG